MSLLLLLQSAAGGGGGGGTPATDPTTTTTSTVTGIASILAPNPTLSSLVRVLGVRKNALSGKRRTRQKREKQAQE